MTTDAAAPEDPLNRHVSPSGILDEQLDLYNWLISERGFSTTAGFLESEDRAAPRPPGIPTRMSGAVEFAATQARACRDGISVLIRSEMVDLIEHAATSLPGQPFHPDDVPAIAGFLYFARPLALTDVNGIRFPIRAITWAPAILTTGDNNAPAGEGVLVCEYVSRRDLGPEDRAAQYTDDLRKRGIWIPDLDLLGYHPLPYGRTLGAPLAIPDDPTPYDLAAASSMLFDRIIITAWIMMRQSIAAPEHVTPSRAHARRWRRQGITPPSAISVVTLRRGRGSAPTEHTVIDWSHRWFVSGHWRRIKHPTTHAERLVWVSPHIRGPEDKPLLLKDRVYDFRR